MKIRILGAHNIETSAAGLVSILIDDVLAVDAGAITVNLSAEQQLNLKAVLLTHQHFDHIRDIPGLGMTYYLSNRVISVFTTFSVYEALQAHVLNDILYPNYIKRPPEKPVFRFNIVEAGRTEVIAGYTVTPVRVNHAAPTVGFQISSGNGKKVFITSDTGPDLDDCWRQVSPDLLIIEVTMVNKNQEFAFQTGHLTPALLQKELESFQRIKGYLPQIILVHMNPMAEKDIKAEIAVVEKTLHTKIRFGYEGMKISL
jgi:ribonuclease BN (tRNA processing enzyme)